MALPLAEFLPVWGFLAANIVSPGPNVLTTIALAMGSGRAAGMGSACGVGIGIGLWCLGMTLGINAALTVLPGLQGLLTVAAVLLLLWFAWRYLRAAVAGYRAKAMRLPPASEGLHWRDGFRRALLVNAINPKALTSWLAVLGLFPVATADAADIALLCAGACALSFGIHSAYTLAFSTPAAARAYLRAGWVLQASAAVLFTGFALRLVAGG
ncbi:MAG: LysE family transporter [Cypionkella sp.]|jgi:threonine/homoserine/homoserine lactone efflux protein|nr:LysE family transporter [Cypionkella sp.]